MRKYLEIKKCRNKQYLLHFGFLKIFFLIKYEEKEKVAHILYNYI